MADEIAETPYKANQIFLRRKKHSKTKSDQPR
jgi:hypothetical protein